MGRPMPSVPDGILINILAPRLEFLLIPDAVIGKTASPHGSFEPIRSESSPLIHPTTRSIRAH